MTANLLPQLGGSAVHHAELMDLMLHHYGRATQPQASEVVFPDEPTARLKVRTKGARITSVLAGPHFDAADFAALRGQVEASLLSGQTSTIACAIFFASAPVEGWYREADGAFHLRPAPARARRPPAFVGDHPFIFEFAAVASPDGRVTFQRLARSRTEWAWLLNALLVTTISVGSSRSRQHWAVPIGQHRRFPLPEWSQDMYWFGGFKSEQASFSRRHGQPITVLPDAAYYGALRPMGPLQLPASLSRSLRAVRSLAPANREQFMRAAQWRYAASDLWDSHISSWYIAQVAAIEALASRPGSRTPCPTCGLDTSPGPTARFRDFLARYAPGLSPVSRSRLYDVRSGLVHGSSILHHDSPFGATLLPALGDERQRMDELHRSVQLAMLRWVEDPS